MKRFESSASLIFLFKIFKIKKFFKVNSKRRMFKPRLSLIQNIIKHTLKLEFYYIIILRYASVLSDIFFSSGLYMLKT